MLVKKVETFLEQKGYELKDKRILVGVSGGPDSLALLHYLWTQREKRNLFLVAAHVDHMFRGEESLQDAIFVQRFCESRNIPFEMEQMNVPAYMRQTGLSSQQAARECRYKFFERLMNEYAMDFLVLGHHGDDQVETILMRLTRGSTGKARAGIPFSRPFQKGEIIRPFLCINREEIEGYCIEHQLKPRRDPSNEKETYSRNRYRKHVLPFLQKENPRVHEHFRRFSEELQSDEDVLVTLAEEKMRKVIKEKKDGEIIILIQGFIAMPMPLQRRGIQLILNYLYKEKPPSLSAIHIDQLFSIIRSPQPSGVLDFPNGLKVVRSYNECGFYSSCKDSPSFRYEIGGPGEWHIPNGSIITMEFVDEPSQEFMSRDHLLLNPEQVTLPLVIRTREHGDWMTVKGMKGTKKLNRIFIDEKVPMLDRKGWPIITDYFNEIIWLPALKKADLSLKPTNGSYILLTYKKL
jgi:tRNA(Ile)-lysidine synthase